MLFAISLVIVVLIMKQAANTKEVIKLPVLNKSIAAGMQINETDIEMKEVGKHNLDNSVIKTKEDIAGTYAVKEIQKGRFVYQEDVSKEKVKSSLMYDVKSGAVSVNTNLVKSVGGIPKAGDWVQVKIVKQDPQTRKTQILSYAELEAVKLISIQSQAGSQVTHDNSQDKNGGIFAGDSELKPALATFDAKPEQVEALLEGEYGGQLHMVMLPPENQSDEVQEKLYEDRLKRALERKKQEALNPQTQTAQVQIGGGSNEVRQ
jgi:Flp pilus assembly protein CpaB